MPRLFFLLLLYCTIAKGQYESLSDLRFPVDKELLLTLVNTKRSQGCQCGDTYYPAVSPLTWNKKLAYAAQKHSDEMAKRKKLTHYSKNGDDPGKRLSKEGYRWHAYTENVAMGYFDERTVIQGWLSSPAHCANIMNPLVKEMGVAYNGKYWTQVFGSEE